MASLIESHPDCPMGRPRGVQTYSYLFKTILFQQLSTKAGQAIYNRVVHFFGGELPSPEVVLDTAPKSLSQLGVSTQKVNYLKGLSERTLVGELPNFSELMEMPDVTIREKLLKIKGVGNWTVDMLLMFNLGRPDIFPSLDLAIQKGHSILTGQRHTPRELAEKVAAWSPWRSYGAWYLWLLVDLEKNQVAQDENPWD